MHQLQIIFMHTSFNLLAKFSHNSAQKAWHLQKTLDGFTKNYCYAAYQEILGAAFEPLKTGVLFCVGGVGALKSMEMWEPSSYRWINLPNMNVGRCGVALAVMNGELYAVGGQNNLGTFWNTAEAYSPVTNTWRPIASMSMSRDVLGLACLNNALYAVGGGFQGELSYLNAVERYDPVVDMWTVVESMLVCRAGVAVAVMQGMIYAIGGSDRPFNTVASCERYDPQLNTWTMISPLNQNRWSAGAAVLDDFIYVAGGWNNENLELSSCEMYNPTTDSWTTLSNMENRRNFLGLAALGNFVYAVGGRGGDYSELSTEAYDPDTNTWKILGAKLNDTRTDHAVAVCELERLTIDNLVMTSQ